MTQLPLAIEVKSSGGSGEPDPASPARVDSKEQSGGGNNSVCFRPDECVCCSMSSI